MAKVKEEGIRLDFSDVKALDPLEEGKQYLCTVNKLDPGPAKSGAGKVHLELSVDEPEGLKGRKLFREFSIQKQAIFSLHAFLKAMGEQDLGDSFLFVPEKYLGSQVVVFVRNEEYQDALQSRPAKFRPASTYEEVVI